MKKYLFLMLAAEVVIPAFGVALSREEIAKLEAKEQLISIRPGDPEKGVPFWTRVARGWRQD